jgi:hypothetical protein
MMMLSPRWGWSDAGLATADAAWPAPSREILVLVLQRENITAVGTTPTPRDDAEHEDVSGHHAN